MSIEPSGFVGRNEGTGGGVGEGEREYITFPCSAGRPVGGTEGSIISTSSWRMDFSSDELSDDESDSDSDPEDSDEEESSETMGFARTCVLSFTVVDSSSSEPEELSSEEDEDSEEEATRLFLFLFRFLAVFAATTAFAVLA